MTSSISVAMATYNGEQFIREQLESIAAQTVLPLELIVCDDVSIDATVEIVTDFAHSSPFPVRLTRNDANLGPSDNFLRAAELCRGKWVAFCDQDDVWLPHKLARVTEAIERYSGDDLMLISHTSLVTDEKLQETGRRLPDFDRDYHVERGGRFPEFCLPGFSLVCRAAMITGINQKLRPVYTWNGGTPGTLGFDCWMSVLANALGDAAYISEPLTLWRRHSRTTSGLAKVKKHSSEKVNVEAVATSLAAVDATPYVNQAILLRSIGDSFGKIAESIGDGKSKKHLSVAAADAIELSDAIARRADLYRSDTYTSRCSALFALIVKNSRFRRKYYSYGFKSFCKDLLFTLRVLG